MQTPDLQLFRTPNETNLKEQWKNPEEIENLPNTKEFSDVKEELADVYYYLLLIAHGRIPKLLRRNIAPRIININGTNLSLPTILI